MEKNSRFMLLVFYLVFQAATINAENYRKCNPHHLVDCPDLTICTPIGRDSELGECKCSREYVFNPTHNKNASDYCIRNPNIPPTGSASGSSAGGAAPSASSSKIVSAISQNEPPGAHHLIGGILIPIVLVLAIVGLVFAVKRLNLVRRAREMFSARRNRPFYEDVMMSNDNDDPPLI